jgi:hypothetical protein
MILFICTLPDGSRRLFQAADESLVALRCLEVTEQFPERVDVAPFYDGPLS